MTHLDPRSSLVTEAQLVLLADDPERSVRAAVARNSKTPQEVLVRLADDADPFVRVAVAGNPRSSRAALDHLSNDAQPEVVLAVARNPATPADVLHHIAANRDDIHGAARHVAFNPSTSLETFALLAVRTRERMRRAGIDRRGDRPAA